MGAGLTIDQMMQDYQGWIDANPDKKDTKEYKQVADDLDAMKASTIEVTPEDGMIEDGQEQPFEFSTTQMIRNFLPSLWKEVQDIGYALTDPSTPESILNLATGVVQKLIPGEQGNEVYADAMAQYFKDKYASGGEAFLKELQNNPAGVLSDASIAIGIPASAVSKGLNVASKIKNFDKIAGVEKVAQAAGETAEKGAKVAGKVSQVAASLDPFNVALDVSLTPALAIGGKISDTVKGIPETFYESALKPSTVLEPAERERIIKTGLEEKIPLNRQGTKILQSKIDELGNKVDNLIDVADQSGTGIPSEIVKTYIGDVKKQVSGFKYKSKSNIKDIEEVVKELDILIKEKPMISAKELQEFKVDLYKQLDYDITKQKGTRAGELAEKSAARAAKEAIAEKVPGVADLNERLGNLLEAKPYLIRGANRIQNRDLIGVGTPIKGGAGAAIGGRTGGIIGTALGLMDLPSSKSRIGIDLYNRMNNPFASLLDNTMSGAYYAGPATRGSLGMVGDINRENQGLLAIDDIKQLYGL